MFNNQPVVTGNIMPFDSIAIFVIHNSKASLIVKLLKSLNGDANIVVCLNWSFLESLIVIRLWNASPVKGELCTNFKKWPQNLQNLSRGTLLGIYSSTNENNLASHEMCANHSLDPIFCHHQEQDTQKEMRQTWWIRVTFSWLLEKKLKPPSNETFIWHN